MELDIFLIPTTPFPKTTLEEVMGCLAYSGSPKTLDEMEAATQQGVQSFED